MEDMASEFPRYSVVVHETAWASVGTLSSETFSQVREQLLGLAADLERRLDPISFVAQATQERVVNVDGLAITCRIDPSRKRVIVVLAEA
jgi:hypothetical protein